MPLSQALAEPRWHDQWRPDEIVIEKAMGTETMNELRGRGHKVTQTESLGASQAIGIDDSGFVAVHDPRVKTGNAQTF